MAEGAARARSRPPKRRGRLGTRIWRLGERTRSADPEARLGNYERTLSRQVRLFGVDAEPTATARFEVAKQLEHLGRVTEARPHWEEVLWVYRRHEGIEHPRTLLVQGWLAVNLMRSGRTEEARRLALHLVDASNRTLGPQDEVTLWANRFLAAVQPDTRAEGPRVPE